MSRSRLLLIAATVLAALAVAALAMQVQRRPASSSASGVALIGGPFHLIDQDGRPVDQSLLKGKWTAVYFGFTYCPDLCPTTLQALAQVQSRLGGEARRLQVVFISVDPQRDTPAQLKAYLSSPVFPHGAIGLTGRPDQIAAAAKAYRAPYEKQADGDSYVVNHASVIYLMDPDGRFDRVLAYGMTPDQMAGQIAAAMRDESGA